MSYEEICLASYDLIKESRQAGDLLQQALVKVRYGDFLSAMALLEEAGHKIGQAQQIHTQLNEKCRDRSCQRVKEHGQYHLMQVSLLHSWISESMPGTWNDLIHGGSCQICGMAISC